MQPQVKETARSQENSGDQRQVDLTPKKVTQNQGTEPQVEVAQPRTVSESKPRVTRSTDVAEAKDASEIKGTDVTSKVTVESGSIEAPQGNKVEPHAGQRVVLKYKLKFEKVYIKMIILISLCLIMSTHMVYQQREKCLILKTVRW